jgi:DNA invertase Pin-like site-specific DNA recombinase
MVRAKRRAKPGNPALAIGYIRVSTDEQRLGPKDQALKLERWAAREGVTLVAVFVDHGVSGGARLQARPGLLAAIAALSSTGSGVLVASVRSRLARDVQIAGTIEAEASKAGAKVRTADGRSDATGSAGVLTKGLDDLLSQWERTVISERTTAALAVKRARGERVGQVPFGSRLAADGKSLEPHPDEQATLAQMLAMRAAGVSLRGIVSELQTTGKPARGSRWHLTTVAKILAR